MTQKDLMTLFSRSGSVADADDFLLYSSASGANVLVSAEVARAYLTRSLSLSVSSSGTLVIGGKDTGTKVEGVTPQLRRGSEALEVSYDKGVTWSPLATFSDLGLDPDIYTSRIESLAVNKADKSDLAALASQVITKAEAADLATLASQVVTKAEAADLAALASQVTTKAEAADLAALASRLDTLSFKAPMSYEDWESLSSDPSNLQPNTIYMTFET